MAELLAMAKKVFNNREAPEDRHTRRLSKVLLAGNLKSRFFAEYDHQKFLEEVEALGRMKTKYSQISA